MASLATALYELLEIHIDAADACEIAVRRSRSASIVAAASALRRDHTSEIGLLREHASDLGGPPLPHRPRRKMWIQARVFVASLLGEEALARALERNEAAVVRAYDIVLGNDQLTRELVALVSGGRVRADDRLRRAALIKAPLESRAGRDRTPPPPREAPRSQRSA